MSYIINCDDGVTVRGETVDELLDNAEKHIRDAHPDLVGKVGRDELRAQVEAV